MHAARRRAAHALTARIEGRRRLEPGQPAEFVVDPATIQLFDPETGEALR
jgi:hypothetical protein